MKTIGQRELRNDNAEVIRRVEEGETYTVTRRGVPVARLGPITDAADLRCVRPATGRPVFADLPRVTSKESSAEVIADLRGDR